MASPDPKRLLGESDGSLWLDHCYNLDDALRNQHRRFPRLLLVNRFRQRVELTLCSSVGFYWRGTVTMITTAALGILVFPLL